MLTLAQNAWYEPQMLKLALKESQLLELAQIWWKEPQNPDIPPSKIKKSHFWIKPLQKFKPYKKKFGPDLKFSPQKKNYPLPNWNAIQSHACHVLQGETIYVQ